MANVPDEEQNEWREALANVLELAVKADRIYRNQIDCLDGEKCLDDTLQDLDEKIKFFVSSVLSGRNFLLSEENANKILFCSFDNIMEEEFIF